MKFELRQTLRGQSDDDVLADLRRCAHELGRDTLTTAEYEEIGKGSPSTIARRFGSWPKALELAGLGPSRSKIGISEDELFANLKSVWTQLGRQPVYHEMKQPLSNYSVRTYESRFGSWTKALFAFVKWVNSGDVVQGVVSTMEDQRNPSTTANPTRRTQREINERQRFRILMRDGFTCSSCGASPILQRGVELHVDHVIPWSKGGETVDENLTAKCARCNLGKGNAFNS
ncbi:MAG: HNH endonuclease [Planctomycetaceae bacterium]|nr:HNH endonuclease [Planctomycetaceae bacterium]